MCEKMLEPHGAILSCLGTYLIPLFPFRGHSRGLPSSHYCLRPLRSWQTSSAATSISI